MPAPLRPSTVAQAAAALTELARDGKPVRPVGTGSRSGWGGRDSESTLDLHTGGLNRILEHDPGDFTAVPQAGIRLADAQAAFATTGQWLAVDPPEPSGSNGGLVATAAGNPGCALQITAHLPKRSAGAGRGGTIRVVHPMTLLDQSIKGGQS